MKIRKEDTRLSLLHDFADHGEARRCQHAAPRRDGHRDAHGRARAERLFGGASCGRTTKLKSAALPGLANLGKIYLEPGQDSCVEALARLLAAEALE